MPWWRKISDARMLVVACVDDHRSKAAPAYTEAYRRIERGDLNAFNFAGQRVTVHAVSGERFIHPTASAGGDRLPDDLPTLVRRAPGGQMQTTEVDGGDRIGRIRLHAPLVPQHLAISPRTMQDTWSLHEPWTSLFPGDSASEFWILKQELLQLSRLPPDQGRSIAATKCRELTETLRCSTELPLWDLRAAEDQEEVLADVAEQFGLSAASWSELRGSPQFRDRTKRPLSIVATRGWAGVIWLQVHLALLDARHCQFAGCDAQLAGSQRKYCPIHKEEAQRTAARNRKRRSRRALR